MIWVVFYVDFPAMRERHFESETAAHEFAKTVNGSVCPCEKKN